MKLTLVFLISMAIVQQVRAVEISNEKVVTATKFNLEEESEFKPWSINMGISNISTHTYNYSRATGSGVTLNLQREVADQFVLGMAYTNYTLNVKKNNDYFQSQNYSDIHSNMFDTYAEFKPIEMEVYGGVYFEAAVNAGISYDSETQINPLFYGIGASLDFNRQIGFRTDLKTYLSKATASTMSLVGYF